MLKKRRYEGGELVETVKTQRAGRASLTELKPPGGLNFNVPRKSQLFVIRHEKGGGQDHFAGSILCMSAMGMIWIDARVVVMVSNSPNAERDA